MVVVGSVIPADLGAIPRGAAIGLVVGLIFFVMYRSFIIAGVASGVVVLRSRRAFVSPIDVVGRVDVGALPTRRRDVTEILVDIGGTEYRIGKLVEERLDRVLGAQA